MATTKNGKIFRTLKSGIRFEDKVLNTKIKDKTSERDTKVKK